MQKIAHCCCGAVHAEVSGEPIGVFACHCEECQRRTGSVFGVSVYYPKAAVRTSGETTLFVRDGQAGRKVRMQFCPVCGTTVFWEADWQPGRIGIAVGTFFDPDFPTPSASAWERSKHHWVRLPEEMRHLERGRPS
jgi:hypothetical protein